MTEENRHIVLKADDLTIGYVSKRNKTIITENLNFSLQQGELTALTGANGIGKSTLLRTLCKMQKELSGNVAVNGISLNDYSFPALAENLSVVLTERPASMNLTAAELVALGRQPYTNWAGRLSEIDKKHIAEAMHASETYELRERKCFELSDGQLQRVLIARALAQNTPLIILDEPTTHLDLYHRVSILKLLKNLSKTKQKTILFSTHDIDLAIQLCDKMIVMTESKTHFGKPEKLIADCCFSELFPKNLIEFDKNEKRFTIKK